MRALIVGTIVLSLSAHGGCGNKDQASKANDKTAKPNPAPTKTPNKTTKQPTPSNAIVVNAAELHKRYFRSAKPRELFAGKRILLTGTIHSVLAKRVFQLVFKAGPARQQVSAVFADRGTAVRDKKLSKGDSATVDCKVRGRLAMRVELDDCVLR